MLCICRTFTFEAAHHLPNYKGKCSRPHGHGFKLEVEVSGRINEKDVSEKRDDYGFRHLEEDGERLHN
jgi:6-pyruvoyl-tetrahydropterin synthase